jgi:hypothetical protein
MNVVMWYTITWPHNSQIHEKNIGMQKKRRQDNPEESFSTYLALRGFRKSAGLHKFTYKTAEGEKVILLRDFFTREKKVFC